MVYDTAPSCMFTEVNSLFVTTAAPSTDVMADIVWQSDINPSVSIPGAGKYDE